MWFNNRRVLNRNEESVESTTETVINIENGSVLGTSTDPAQLSVELEREKVRMWMYVVLNHRQLR